MKPHSAPRKPIFHEISRGIGEVGIALEWHSRGQGFESPMLQKYLGRACKAGSPDGFRRMRSILSAATLEMLSFQGFFYFLGDFWDSSSLLNNYL